LMFLSCEKTLLVYKKSAITIILKYFIPFLILT
jgi:hypothetical protein